jgi:SAM-dependent methyltransferase
LANALRKETATNAASYPLELFLCESCGLAQLMDVVDPEILFGSYLYVSGTSPSMRSHWQELAEDASERVDLQPRDFVVEIASNDGTLLIEFQKLGATVLGIEPASNIVEIARDRGVPTHHGFFDSKTATEVRGSNGTARVVTANNVLAHVDDPLDFLTGAASLLDDDGILITEVPFARNLVRDVEYDTIYHEHLCYFSLSPLLTLFERAGLGVLQAIDRPVHGGSLRIIAKRDAEHSNEVVARAKVEADTGLLKVGAWREFARRVISNRDKMQSLLRGLLEDGAKVWGYGAPAKASTLLNYCNIGSDQIMATADRSPLKIGRFIPGVNIPIRSVEELLEDAPDYVLILAWNLSTEIRAALSQLEKSGTRFIVPHPVPGELSS